MGYGRWQESQEGALYTVLQYIEGATLLEWARKAKPSPRQLVGLVRKVALALQAAHERGVLHRDVKPGNLLVREADGEPFLADFGVGVTEHSPPLTRGGSPPGTRHFQSPEALAFSQRSSGAPYRFQPADDWYALGVTLYQVLTEVLPFPDSPGGHRAGREALRPVPPHLLNPRVPLPLSQVVLRLLAGKPRQRYWDGHALCAALDQALAHQCPWDAPMYEPTPPHELGRTPTQAPTTGDGYVAEDLDVVLAHEARQEQGHEEQRQAAAQRRRDALLAARSGARPSAVRYAVAAVAVLVAATGVALVALARPAPAVRPSPAPGPAVDQPKERMGTPPVPPVAAPAPALVAAPVPETSLAAITATSQKEDTPVKTPQSPPPGSPTAAASTKRSSSAARKASLCAAGLLATGCPGISVRPEPKECPPAALNSMQALGIGKEDGGIYSSPEPTASVQWDVNMPKAAKPATFRVGPVVGKVDRTLESNLPVGTLLFGKIIAGGGKYFFIRYEEAQLPGSSQRVPVCAVASDQAEPFGLVKEPGSTDDSFTHLFNVGHVRFVTKFAE